MSNQAFAFPGLSQLAVMVLALLLVPPVGAQTCAAPVPINSPMPPLSDDTCAWPNSLVTIGSIPSPQNDFVLSFVGHPSLQGQLHVEGDFEGAVYLLPGTCNATTDPVAVGFFGAGGNATLPVTGLPQQPYYVVVTGAPESLPTTCGQFLLLAQIQIVDVVFQDGFE